MTGHALPNLQSKLVVISVVNWNTPAQTLACLRSISALTYPFVRVVVVDNASHDDSLTIIGDAQLPLTILRSSENLGFAGGHRLSWQIACDWQADAIWLVNSDALVEADALTRLVEAWARHGDAIYGALPLRRRADDVVLFDFPSKYLDESGRPEIFRRDRDVVFDSAWQTRAPMRVGAAPGAALFMPMSVTRTHGWLDESWFMYCEEIDYCYRLRREGVARYLVPAARVWHAGAGSQYRRPRVRDAMDYYHTRNQVLLARRYGGWLAAYGIALKKLMRGLITLPLHPARARFIFHGAWDGARGTYGKRYAPEAYL